MYIHCIWSHASPEKQGIFDLLTPGSGSVLCASGRQLQVLGPKVLSGMLDKTATAPMHSVHIRALAHSAVCSISLAHSNSSTALPRNSNHHWCNYYRKRVGSWRPLYKRAAISDFTSCVNCTHSMIPEQKIQLLWPEGHINPQSLLYCMQSELLPWAFCVSLSFSLLEHQLYPFWNNQRSMQKLLSTVAPFSPETDRKGCTQTPSSWRYQMSIRRILQ